MLKIEKEAKLMLLRKELARLNIQGHRSAKEFYARKRVADEIEELERELISHKREDYPTDTVVSPRHTTHEYEGKVVRLGNRRKFVAKEPKEYQPLLSEKGKSDTLSGYGEKRKRYVR